MISFAFVALLGIIINAIIIKQEGEEALGIFNQVNAVYIMLSQLAVGGVHLSVQRYIPLYAHHKKSYSEILFSSLILVAIISVVVVSLCYIFYDLPGKILNSKSISKAFFFSAFGLVFFSFNKVLISFQNALRRMKTFALLQFMRMFFMFTTIVFLLYYKYDAVYLASSLAISELLLFFICVLFAIPMVKWDISLKNFKRWLKIHFRFGNKAFAGNFLLDVNTKVDVFVLGIFYSDSIVGIYSFASTFAEGFMQLPVLLRNNLNPILAKLKTKSNNKFKEVILKKMIKKSFLLLVTAAVFSIIVFPLIFFLFGIDENRITIWLVYSILVLLLGLGSGYQPLVMIFNQFGKPGIQTFFIVIQFTMNVLLNFILVPLLGIFGSALATGLVFVIQITIQKALVKKAFALSI